MYNWHELIGIHQAVDLILNLYTVKLVYTDHHGEQQNVVFIHRWPLYTGSVTWKVYPWGPVNTWSL